MADKTRMLECLVDGLMGLEEFKVLFLQGFWIKPLPVRACTKVTDFCQCAAKGNVGLPGLTALFAQLFPLKRDIPGLHVKPHREPNLPTLVIVGISIDVIRRLD